MHWVTRRWLNPRLVGNVQLREASISPVVGLDLVLLNDAFIYDRYKY